MTAAELALGITKPQLKQMNQRLSKLELDNDAIALTRVRHEISQRVVEIRLLLRDGHLKNTKRG